MSEVDPNLWEIFLAADPASAAFKAGCIYKDGIFKLEMIGKQYVVDRENKKITLDDGTKTNRLEDLILLNYLSDQGSGGINGKQVSLKQLNGGEMFFKKEHAPATDKLPSEIQLNDNETFLKLGKAIGANITGEASIKFWALPQIPMEAFFFAGDDEFPATITLTIDSGADKYMDLGAIYGLVNQIAARFKEAAEQIS